MTRAELAEMISLAERLAAADEPTVVATLFSSNGSTYRRLGAMMISGPPGMMAGGVSGGCLEEYIARHGRSLIETHDAAMLSFDADPDGNASGKPVLGCGGSIEILVERCTPAHITFLRELAAASAIDEQSTFACIVNISESIFVRRPRLDDSTKTETDPQLQRLRDRAISGRQSRHGMLDPTRRALIHYVSPMTRLVILGAGNDVAPLTSLARSLGWHVTVADRRGRLAAKSHFPEADDVIAADWSAAIGRIQFTPQTAVVMMTHSLVDDIAIVPLLANKPMAYVGCLGPAHRRGWVLEGAARESQISEPFVSRFRGPIGLNLGDRTSTGIAVSIIGEILSEMNGRDAMPMSQPAGQEIDAPRNVVIHV